MDRYDDSPRVRGGYCAPPGQPPEPRRRRDFFGMTDCATPPPAVREAAWIRARRTLRAALSDCSQYSADVAVTPAQEWFLQMLLTRLLMEIDA